MNSASARQASCRDGLTLVEILVATLVLGTLAIAGGAIISRGQIDMMGQKYKRAAIEAANEQMETVVREWDYSRVQALAGSSQVTNTSLNGVSGFGVRTSVANSGSSGNYCLKITVRVEYQKNGDAVSLETYRSK